MPAACRRPALESCTWGWSRRALRGKALAERLLWETRRIELEKQRVETLVASLPPVRPGAPSSVPARSPLFLVRPGAPSSLLLRKCIKKHARHAACSFMFFWLLREARSLSKAPDDPSGQQDSLMHLMLLGIQNAIQTHKMSLSALKEERINKAGCAPDMASSFA